MSFLFGRVAAAALVMVLVSGAVFFLLRLAPGDPIYMLLSPEDASSLSAGDVQELRARYGLDQPVIIQYFTWLGGAVQGNLGWSIHMRQPVVQALAQRLPVSLELAGLALILCVATGVPLGILAATRRGTAIDTLATALAVGGASAPSFWLGLLLMFAFAFAIPLLPPSGYTAPDKDVVANLRLMVLPAVTLAAGMTAAVMRMTRSSMLEVLVRDYMRTAAAKGLGRRQILVRHALKNALIPVATVVGLQAGRALGGVFLVEYIFAIPGLGHLGVTAIFNRDYALVQGVALIAALGYTVVNLLVDLTYAYLDPRVRLS